MGFGFLVGDRVVCLNFLAGGFSASEEFSAKLGLLRLRDWLGKACCRRVAEDEARVVRRVRVDTSEAYGCRAPLNVVVWLKLGSGFILPCDTCDAMMVFALSLTKRDPSPDRDPRTFQENKWICQLSISCNNGKVVGGGRAVESGPLRGN